VTGAKALKQEDVPFYKHQMRVLLEHSGWIDPTSIDDYVANGGYQALQDVLAKSKPEQVVEAILKSGLRGRGGGGFPAGLKWKECRGAPSADGVRAIIANGDEGDPGAFMDRSLMEGNPHLVLEGMIIGAWAIGWPGRPEAPSTSATSTAGGRAARAGAGAGRQLGCSATTSSGRASPSTSASTRAAGVRLRRVDGADRVDRGQVGEPRAKHIQRWCAACATARRT